MKYSEQESINTGRSARFGSNHLASMAAGLFVFFMIIVRFLYFYHAQDSVLISVILTMLFTTYKWPNIVQ